MKWENLFQYQGLIGSLFFIGMMVLALCAAR